MKRSLGATALSTFCSAASLALAACNPAQPALAPVRPPDDRMDCRELNERPTIPPEYRIDWSRVRSVDQARSEVDALVRSIRTREGIVAGYVVQAEERLFVCANDAAWMRDFFTELPE